jgi:LPXTG-motif cell wall-anchored protein
MATFLSLGVLGESFIGSVWWYVIMGVLLVGLIWYYIQMKRKGG